MMHTWLDFLLTYILLSVEIVGMNIYLLKEDDGCCVVCAVSEEDAKKIHPDGYNANIQYIFIGTAAPNVERGVICAI